MATRTFRKKSSPREKFEVSPRPNFPGPQGVHVLINLTHLFYDVHAGCLRNPFSCVDSTIHKESLFVRSWFAFQLKYKQQSEKDKALKAKFNSVF